jgi:predicted DNA-binding antitoxin AbrB/MazE fold protein
MSIHVLATYRNGVIEPDHPLNLADHTKLEVVVIPVIAGQGSTSAEETAALRPGSPQISPAEVRDLITRYAVSVGSLPHDFSRDDIYRDHD